MKPATLPLLDLFSRLHERNYPLGIQEYLSLQKALATGFGVGSRRDLIFLCRTLWAKSTEEAAQIEDLLRIVLPKELTRAQLDELVKSLEEFVEQTGETSASPPAADAPERPGAKLPETAPDASGAVSAEQKNYREAGAIRLDKNSEPTDINIPMPAIQSLPPNLHRDFTGRMPVTTRQMKRAWRYYRRMQRIGSPTELDIPATIKRIYQQGILLRPVLVPRRSNQARMLILADAGGSMVPFQRMVDALINSAGHSGLAKTAAFYFHDAAQKFFYRDAGRTIPVEIDDALAEFGNAGVLIVSDAGAARGNYDERRVEQTGGMLKALRLFTPNVAWLNPAPKNRWSGTTAEAVSKRFLIPMYQFDRPGLDAAVEVMRGRSAEEYKG